MNRLYKAFALAAILLAIFCSFKACSYAKKLDNEIAENIKLKTANQAYTVRIRKDSTTIYTQKILQANQQAANAHSGAKKTQTSVKAKIGVKIEGVNAPYIAGPQTAQNSLWPKDSISGHSTTTGVSDSLSHGQDCIPIGTQFSVTDKWYSLSGTLDTNSVNDISIGLTPGDISVVVSGRKGKESATISVQNPYIQLSNISSVTVKQKRPLLLSRSAFLVYGLIGGATGYILLK